MVEELSIKLTRSRLGRGLVGGRGGGMICPNLISRPEGTVHWYLLPPGTHCCHYDMWATRRIWFTGWVIPGSKTQLVVQLGYYLFFRKEQYRGGFRGQGSRSEGGILSWCTVADP